MASLLQIIATCVLIGSFICFWSLIHRGCFLYHILAGIGVCAWKAEPVLHYLWLTSMTSMGLSGRQHGWWQRPSSGEHLAGQKLSKFGVHFFLDGVYLVQHFVRSSA